MASAARQRESLWHIDRRMSWKCGNCRRMGAEMKPKLQIEDYEYSPKAAHESAQRAAPTQAANQARAQHNRQEGQRIARELSAAQQQARQPIADESALAKSLIQLGAVLGVQPKIERRKKRP
jgi:hypothetical protein